jgi:isopentenyl-diphosphate Delta-isomerase
MEVQQVILVNEQDVATGAMEKMEAHKKGELHRAFSVFIFNSKGEMLLQQRAANKYHSGGLWTNTCCSHPRPDEDILAAAQRRLQEEMGFSSKLEKIFDFIYRADFNNGLTEYEFDHVFAGKYEGSIDYNKEEVMDYCYKSMGDLRHSLEQQPHKFSKWFQLAFPKIDAWWQQHYNNNAV